MKAACLRVQNSESSDESNEGGWSAETGLSIIGLGGKTRADRRSLWDSSPRGRRPRSTKSVHIEATQTTTDRGGHAADFARTAELRCDRPNLLLGSLAFQLDGPQAVPDHSLFAGQPGVEFLEIGVETTADFPADLPPRLSTKPVVQFCSRFSWAICSSARPSQLRFQTLHSSGVSLILNDFRNDSIRSGFHPLSAAICSRLFPAFRPSQYAVSLAVNGPVTSSINLPRVPSASPSRSVAERFSTSGGIVLQALEMLLAYAVDDLTEGEMVQAPERIVEIGDPAPIPLRATEG